MIVASSCDLCAMFLYINIFAREVLIVDVSLGAMTEMGYAQGDARPRSKPFPVKNKALNTSGVSDVASSI